MYESERYRCDICNEDFESWDRLAEHRQKKALSGDQRHLVCSECGQGFQSQVALLSHTKTYHPHKQTLHCPACLQGPFNRMWKLISHIESGQCYKFNVKDIEELREKKLAFSRHLLLKNWDTAEPSVLEALIAKSNGPSSMNTIPETHHQQPCKPQAPSVVPGSSKPEAVSLIGTFGSWHTAEVPPPTVTPKTESSRKSMPKPSQDVQINVEGCYCELSGRYVCPRASCQKVFKTAKQLLKHLQSPAHSGVSFNCPRCLRTFKSLTEIVSHVELSGPACPIRSTDDFGAYLDFLTGGLLEVCRESFPDETLKYAVPIDVRDLFHIQSQTEAAVDASEDLIQW